MDVLLLQRKRRLRTVQQRLSLRAASKSDGYQSFATPGCRFTPHRTLPLNIERDHFTFLEGDLHFYS